MFNRHEKRNEDDLGGGGGGLYASIWANQAQLSTFLGFVRLLVGMPRLKNDAYLRISSYKMTTSAMHVEGPNSIAPTV